MRWCRNSGERMKSIVERIQEKFKQSIPNRSWLGKCEYVSEEGRAQILIWSKVAGDTNLNYKLHKKNRIEGSVNEVLDMLSSKCLWDIQVKMSKRLMDTRITEQRSRLKHRLWNHQPHPTGLSQGLMQKRALRNKQKVVDSTRRLRIRRQVRTGDVTEKRRERFRKEDQVSCWQRSSQWIE